jgi:hypothetical protein
MQWEYLVVEQALSRDDLGEFGSEGWELVAVVRPEHYFFKREASA